MSLQDVTSTTTDVTGGISSLAAMYRKFAKYANVAGAKTGSHIRDLYTNGFLARSSVFVPQFYSRAFDEPTYLTFRVEFDLDGDYPNNKIYNSNDGAYNMYDMMPEPFFVMDDAPNPTKYSTYNYLKENLGEIGRAKILKDMILGIRDVQNIFPYYFQSISGLGDLIKVDPKRGQRIGNDTFITLKCYEGLDLKIAQIIESYKKVVWDDLYQRWVLPDMMRYFSMRIYISELRMFHDFRNITALKKPMMYDLHDGEMRNMTYRKPSTYQTVMQAIDQGISAGGALTERIAGTASTVNQWYSGIQGMYQDIESTTMNIMNSFGMLCNNVINAVMPTICLECHMCEFDIAETGGFINNLTSSREGNKAVEHEIKIKVGNVVEQQVYPLNVNIGMGSTNYYLNDQLIDDELLDQNYVGSSDSIKIAEENYNAAVNNASKNKNIASALHKFTNAKYAKNGTASMYNEMTDDTLSYNKTIGEVDEANLTGSIISDVYSTVNTIYNVATEFSGNSRSSATNGSVPDADLGIKEGYDSQAASIKQQQNNFVLPNPYSALPADNGTISGESTTQASIYAGEEHHVTGNENEERTSIYEDTITAVAGNTASKAYMKILAKSIYENPAIRSMAVGDDEKRVIMDSIYKNALDKISESGALEGTEAGHTIDNIREMLSETYKRSNTAEERKSAFDYVNGKQ